MTTEPNGQPTLADVQAARVQAANSHAALIGDTSACAISKSGKSFPAGKFWEGQTAALSELLRAKPADVAAEAARLHELWAVRPVPGNPREAESYRAGGLEALSGLLAGPAQIDHSQIGGRAPLTGLLDTEDLR